MASVLIIDDDPVIQLLLRASFEQDGWDVITASDGEQGLVAAREHRPTFVLLDVMMPKLDGYGVLKALREDDETKDMTVALLSAKSGDEDRAKGMEAGANAYLSKPFDPLTLLSDVRKLVEAQQEGRL
jgi:DNA-binding response OmpR family regulator